MATSQSRVALVKYCSNIVIPVHAYHPYSGVLLASSALFWIFVWFRSVPVFSNASRQMRQIDNYKRNQWQLRNHVLPWQNTVKQCHSGPR